MTQHEQSNAFSLLSVPKPAAARHPDTITQPSEIVRWLNDLLLMAPEQRASQVYRQLQLQVRDPELDKRYAQRLAAFHPTIRELQHQLWMAFNRPSNHRIDVDKLLPLISDLLLELSSGHSRNINTAINLGQKPQAATVYHALLPLHHLLLWHTHTYKLLHPSLWRQILQLYELAALYDLSGVTVTSELATSTDTSDIHSVFHTALLTLLADPYRLDPSEIDTLVGGIGALAHHLHISQSPKGQHQLAIDPSGQIPPLRFARLQPAAQQTPTLKLDAFLAALDQQGIPGDDDKHIEKWLRQTLLSLSGLPEQKEARRYTRYPRVAPYRCTIGLSAITQRLRDIQQGPSDVIEMHGIQLETSSSALDLTNGTECEQRDHSLSGACFMMPNTRAIPDVHDWVLFESADKASHQGFVARVKRRVQTQNDAIEIGVEKLPGSLVPVTLGNSQRLGLLNTHREQALAQLITSDTDTPMPPELVVHAINKDYRIQLEEELERSNSLRQRVRFI